MTKFREVVDAEYAKVRKLTADRKVAKAKLAAAYAEYAKFIKETYKPGRKAAFDAIAKLKADRKATLAKAKADRKIEAEKKASEKKAKDAAKPKVTAKEVIAKGEASLKKFKKAAAAKKPVATKKVTVKQTVKNDAPAAVVTEKK